jgi:hypothetical protein
VRLGVRYGIYPPTPAQAQENWKVVDAPGDGSVIVTAISIRVLVRNEHEALTADATPSVIIH